MHWCRRIAVGAFVLLTCVAVAPADTFPARDTLGELHDDQPAAARLLEQVRWTAEAFEVTVSPLPWNGEGDALVQFPSPQPAGDRRMDRVAMLWFQARDEAGQPLEEPAPAVVLIHSVHPHMVISKMLARAFSRQGLHAFVVQMPGYGERARLGLPGLVVLLEHATQAVADTRRARDAVAALPQVAEGPIALQGTSLGGFVASVAAALDGAFDPVLLALTGGDGWDVLQHGERDAAFAREQLARYGYAGEALRDRLDRIEPLHVAHRLSPTRTWLFTGRQDTVIRPANANALARAIGVDDGQHRRYDVDHYSAILQLPVIVREMVEIVRDTHR